MDLEIHKYIKLGHYFRSSIQIEKMRSSREKKAIDQRSSGRKQTKTIY